MWLKIAKPGTYWLSSVLFGTILAYWLDSIVDNKNGLEADTRKYRNYKNKLASTFQTINDQKGTL